MIPGPRVIKSHLPLTYWRDALDKSPGTKVIQTIRNPKDTLVSLYHFMKVNRLMGYLNGTWDEYFEMMKEGYVIYGSYFQFNAEWYQYNMKRENSLVLFYEDMKKGLLGHIKKIADFLSISLSERAVDLITEATTFQNMVKNPKLNPKNADIPVPMFKGDNDCILRKGEVGQWKDYMNDEQLKYIDDKVKEIFDPIGLKFD